MLMMLGVGVACGKKEAQLMLMMLAVGRECGLWKNGPADAHESGALLRLLSLDLHSRLDASFVCVCVEAQKTTHTSLRCSVSCLVRLGGFWFGFRQSMAKLVP